MAKRADFENTTTADDAPDGRNQLERIDALSTCLLRARSIVACVADALDHEGPAGSGEHYASGALRSARDILDEATVAGERLDELRYARVRPQAGAAGE